MEDWAGVYGINYQVCALQPGRTELCSPWRDSGKVNWMVPGEDFTAADIVIHRSIVPPHRID
jgi:hypothetical protein